MILAQFSCASNEEYFSETATYCESLNEKGKVAECYVKRIQNSVRSNFRNSKKHYGKDAFIETEKIKIIIKMNPLGEIYSIKMLNSSGSDLLDSLAIDSINNSSPFELPKEKSLFYMFREIQFVF